MHYAVIYNLLTQHWTLSEELRTDLFTSQSSMWHPEAAQNRNTYCE